jgi:PAS domain S-box-containing protein
MADVVSLLNMNLKVTYISPSVKKIMGYDTREYLEMTLDKLITPDSLKKIYEIFEEELEIEKRGDSDPHRTRIIKMEQIKKDGTKIWMEDNLSFLRDEKNIPVGIISVSRDITQNKLLENNIAESESRFKSLFDNMGSGVAVYI